MSAGPGSPVVMALGLSLLHFLWQGCLVWALTALGLRLARQGGARLRHAIAIAGLIACSVMPVTGLLGRLRAPAAPPLAHPATPFVEMRERKDIQPLRQGPAQPRPAGLEESLAKHLDLIVLAWLCGTALLSLRLLSGALWVRGMRRGAEPSPEAWRLRLRDIAAGMGVARPVRLGLSACIDTPMVLGWWRPLILFPVRAITGMDDALLEALLAHELAHVQRLDYLVNLVQRGLETLLFYHPAVWWISRQIRVERELICDELAARALGEPRRLALALKELDRLQLSTPPHLAQAAHGGNLMRRIRNLIQPDTRPFAWNGLLPLAGIAILLLAGTAITVHAQEKKPAAAAPEAAAAAKGAIHHFAFGQQDGKAPSGCYSTRHAKEIKALQGKLGQDVLWFREDGVSYVIHDTAIVARARELYRPVEELGAEMGRMGEKMGEAGGRMGEVGGRMGSMGGKLGEIGGRMGAVGGKMGTVHARLDAEGLSEAERGKLEQDLQSLKAEMRGLREEMAKARAEMASQKETLRAQMDEHKKPMQELSKEMRALGMKMKEASRQAETGIAELIRTARKEGKVAKAPDQLQ